jgi:hypothetical protein
MKIPHQTGTGEATAGITVRAKALWNGSERGYHTMERDDNYYPESPGVSQHSYKPSLQV